mmetsp:Transcript_58503/g.187954  ORF Transcript_58503/g.187954 Transcript_58503/m.187954 type:complete len:739 (+) Transcript_58503:82-2298(+)
MQSTQATTPSWHGVAPVMQPAAGQPRERSRSPKRLDARLEALLGAQGADTGGLISTTFELPSPKLGQLLGYKGVTIQKIKEVAGVSRLHIHDKEKAKFQPSVIIEVAGSAECVSRCLQLLEALCAGDQSEIGHFTSYLNVESTVIGKLMGHKGQTVKEMTDITNCYIEIQQYPEQGVTDGQPRLFFAGPPDQVEAAVQLAERFIAAPGSRLDTVLGYSASAAAQAQAPQTQQLQPHLQQLTQQLAASAAPKAADTSSGGHVLSAVAALIGALSQPSRASPPGQPATALAQSAHIPEVTLPDPTAPVEERIMEVPARFKGHLLGLHGTTIETIRQTSGVIKCHMQEKRDVDRWGPIHVQILGTHECVEACAKLINGVLVGDHTGIGHSTTYINIDPSVVGKIMGHKGQTIKELTETTGCYIEIQQYPEQGVTDGQPRLFVAGPPASVDTAVSIIERFIAAPGSRLEAVLGPGEVQKPAQAQAQQTNDVSAGLAALSSVLGALATSAGGSMDSLVPDGRGGLGQGAASSTASVLAALAAAAGAMRTQVEVPLLDGGVEERVIEVPTSKKGHLLGLRGQTIETVRQMSGVKKCHMMDKTGQGSWGGTIPIQIVGTRACVEKCIEMVNGIVAGDHSSIGHTSDILPVDTQKVNGLMGHRGQTCTLLKDLTGCYLDIQQGPQAGVPAGEARVFMAGPPDNVRKARTVLSAFLAMMDTLQVTGGLSGGGTGLVDLLKGFMGGFR